MSVFTAYLHSNCGEVSYFARKNLILCGISTVVFLVNNSGGVFLLRISGKARFFPAVQIICRFGNFVKFNLNLPTHGFGFDFCVKRKDMGL